MDQSDYDMNKDNKKKDSPVVIVALLLILAVLSGYLFANRSQLMSLVGYITHGASQETSVSEPEGSAVSAETAVQQEVVQGASENADGGSISAADASDMKASEYGAEAAAGSGEGAAAAETQTVISGGLSLTDDRRPDMVKLSQSMNGEEHPVEYHWTSYDQQSSDSLSWNLDTGAYNYYKSLPRQYTMDFVNYLTDDYTRQLLQKVNEALDGICEQRDSDSEFTRVSEAISFVQGIPYMTDVDSNAKDEWPKYPIETLYDCCGDCEDKALLLAGLLHERGYGVILIVYDDHCSVGIQSDDLGGSYFEYDGAKYYYVETTEPGWQIGEVPEKYQSMSAKIIKPNY